MIHPLVVREDLVRCFSYWNERIQEGMHFKNDLYTYFQSFSTAHRLSAYGLAYEQIEQGNKVCITVSETRYVIWLCLRGQAPMKALNRNVDSFVPREMNQRTLEMQELCMGI